MFCEGFASSGAGLQTLEPKTSNPSPRSWSPSPRTLEPSSEPRTPAPEPRTPALEPGTPAPEPRTADPEPRTPALEPGSPAPESRPGGWVGGWGGWVGILICTWPLGTYQQRHAYARHGKGKSGSTATTRRVQESAQPPPQAMQSTKECLSPNMLDQSIGGCTKQQYASTFA